MLIEREILANDISLKKWLIDTIQEEIDAIAGCAPDELEDFYEEFVVMYVDKSEILRSKSERRQWSQSEDTQIQNHYEQQVLTMVRITDITRRNGELV